MSVKPILFLCLLLLSGEKLFAQSGNDDPDYDHLDYVMAGVDFSGNNVYTGRKDSVRLPYLSPYIGVHNHWGLFADVSASYTFQKNNDHVDVVTLDGGYEHKFGKFNTGASISEFFYSATSTAIESDIKTQFEGFATYEKTWIKPKLDFQLLFGTKTDVVTNLDLSHKFLLFDEALTIEPTTAMYAGTQHYFDGYFKRKAKKSKTATNDVTVSENSGKFRVLDYELSMPIDYENGPWVFSFNPRYAIPVDPAKLKMGKKTYTEALHNTFWIEAGICFRLKLKRADRL